MSEKKNILIVDDSQEILGLLHYELKIHKMNATETTNTHDAIKELSEKKFDFILLDIFLNQGSSEDILRHLKKEDSLNKQTPIILMSGMINNDFIERNQDKVAKILVKPFKKGDVTNAIKELL